MFEITDGQKRVRSKGDEAMINATMLVYFVITVIAPLFEGEMAAAGPIQPGSLLIVIGTEAIPKGVPLGSELAVQSLHGPRLGLPSKKFNLSRP